MTSPTKVHKDHAVTLNGQFKFDVKGPALERIGYNSFDTCEKALEAIDRAVAAKTKADTLKLSLKVIDRAGNAGVITGIHKAQGHVTIRGDADVGSDLYPDVPWIKAILRKREELNKQLQDLTMQVHPYEVRRSRAYHKLSSEGHVQALESLLEDYNRKNEKAQKKGEDK